MLDSIKELLTTIIAAVGFLLMICFTFMVLWFGNFVIILGILILLRATKPLFPAVIIGLLITTSNIIKERKK